MQYYRAAQVLVGEHSHTVPASYTFDVKIYIKSINNIPSNGLRLQANVASAVLTCTTFCYKYIWPWSVDSLDGRSADVIKTAPAEK